MILMVKASNQNRIISSSQNLTMCTTTFFSAFLEKYHRLLQVWQWSVDRATKCSQNRTVLWTANLFPLTAPNWRQDANFKHSFSKASDIWEHRNFFIVTSHQENFILLQSKAQGTPRCLHLRSRVIQDVSTPLQRTQGFLGWGERLGRANVQLNNGNKYIVQSIPAHPAMWNREI